ncbi:MAG: hypothetical protein WCJ35_15725 [Planctomycetota bacterium]
MKKLWNWLRPRRERFAAPNNARIGLLELEQALESVEPAARFVLPRLLRRVVRLHTSLPGMGFRVPHGKTYVIPSKALWEIAEQSEIGFSPSGNLPEDVILLERPGSEILEEWPRGEVLLYCWELLFHSRIHKEFHRLAKQQCFGAAEFEERLAALGSLEFDEIRNVLRNERFLLPPYDAPSAYVEFAAVYLGIRYFKPYLIASFFPALESLAKIDEVIAQDIDASNLLEATRLPGTPDPEELREAARAAAEAFDTDPLGMVSDFREDVGSRGQDAHWTRGRQRSEKNYLLWSQRAERQTARGNLAGAAIRRARAEFWAPRERAAEAATALREEVHGLVDRLLTALRIEDDEPRPWREALLALAHQTPRGLWTVEARLLYDLQKVCVDQERTIFTIDVMHWILSLGRRPIRRELPNQREVLVSRYLRSAQRRLSRVRISDRQRRQLTDVLGRATEDAETRLRDNLRLKIVATLDGIGLVPRNLPERISRTKLVEELLDRIVDRGFLTLSEVRDALSRNQLKEPDCSGPRSFRRGDAALRVNRRLAETLDGVYEPGDFYLRWILRFSHLMFGTVIGRFLTLYLVIPFGGAYVALKGSDHLIELIAGINSQLAPSQWDWDDFVPNLLLGVFLAMVIHIPSFRGIVWRGLKTLGRAIKWLLIDSLQAFFALPWVHWIVHSAAARLAINYGVKPLAPTLLLAVFIRSETNPWQKIIGLTSMFFTLTLIVNSRAGRNVEEIFFDAIGEGWQRFGVRPIVGLFWFIVDLFRRLMQLFERLLYAVDEWLRFRSGQGRTILLAKAGLGVVWFFVAYVIRFCVNLLIEPQLNPLKHIPWVSVSHKMLAPLWPTTGLHGFLRYHMNAPLANLTMAAIVTLTPGIFGFLIWELKENWRLFAANRSKNLQPVLVGSHGETLLRLLRPGFHSGTIPKRFAKLRRAERKSLRGGDSGVVRKHREVLHHIEVDLHRYIEREFIAWFRESRGWTLPRPHVDEIHLATNSATIEIMMPPAVEGPLVMAFQVVDGRLQLELSGKVCNERLSAVAHHVFRTAIINVLKTGGVERFCHSQCARLSSLIHSSDEAMSADDAVPPLEIGSLAMPWPEWVAMWETDRDAPELTGWGRVSVM